MDKKPPIRPLRTVTVTEFYCQRCDGIWWQDPALAIRGELPTVCGRCKSKLWDTPIKRPAQREAMKRTLARRREPTENM